MTHVFEEYCAVLFFKGDLLKDTEGILSQQTKNTQAARQIRFTTVQEIVAAESTLKAYIEEAVEVEKAGLQVEYRTNTAFVHPEEVQSKFDANPALQTAFEASTPGRQRAYQLYFAAPKQAKTREARLEKWSPQILDGKGLNDEFLEHRRDHAGH